MLYLCGVIAFTLFPLPEQTAASCAGVTTAAQLSLNPLDSVAATPAAVLQLGLNVVLFVPLGFLLRYRFRRGLAVRAVLGLGVSLLVEGVQLSAVFGLFDCPYRLADTADLVTNTAGAVSGWLLAAGTGRLLPEPEPEPALDTGAPGIVRRGLAGADLLIAYLRTLLILVVLFVAGVEAPAENTLPAVVLHLVVLTVTTLVVPLYRRNRATLGQVTFHLAPRPPGAAAAVRARFVLGFVPAGLLLAAGHLGVQAVAAMIVGGLSRRRADQRSVLEVLTRTPIETRGGARQRKYDAARHDVGPPADADAPSGST